jgi:predicted nucleic acid-binding protein
MKVHILDANALYRFLTGGPGAEIVSSLFKEARNSEQALRMSVINWGEVYYTIARAEGFDKTAQVMKRARMLPLAILDAGEALTVRAARLKAAHGLHYADCFAAATVESGSVLVTSDAKDFKKIPGLNLLPLPEHKS